MRLITQGGPEGIGFFEYELDDLYTKWEAELIQQYLHEHGELPGGGMNELDNLL